MVNYIILNCFLIVLNEQLQILYNIFLGNNGIFKSYIYKSNFNDTILKKLGHRR